MAFSFKAKMCIHVTFLGVLISPSSIAARSQTFSSQRSDGPDRRIELSLDKKQELTER
jgi:hypothetical protein